MVEARSLLSMERRNPVAFLPKIKGLHAQQRGLSHAAMVSQALFFIAKLGCRSSIFDAIGGSKCLRQCLPWADSSTSFRDERALRPANGRLSAAISCAWFPRLTALWLQEEGKGVVARAKR